MEGTLLDVNMQTKKGLIRDLEGDRIYFALDEWISEEPPQKGDHVDFIIDAGNAKQIVSMPILRSTASKPEKPNAPIEVAAQTHTAASAILSLIFGVLSLLTFFIGIVFAIVAILSGHLARKKIAKNISTFGGDGLAIAGLTLGYLVLFAWLLFVLGAVAIS